MSAIYISYFKCSCIKLITSTHSTYHRYRVFLSLHDEFYLGCNCIYSINYIIKILKNERGRILRQKEFIPYLYINIWINI